MWSSPKQQLPRWPDLETIARKEDLQRKYQRKYQQTHHDSAHRAKPLPPLKPGDDVWIPDQGVEAKVRDRLTERSYHIEGESGQMLRRNRHDIVHLPSSSDKSAVNSDKSDESSPSPSEADCEPMTESPHSTLRKSERSCKEPDRLGYKTVKGKFVQTG